jgi:hypothetical protein
LTAHRIKRVFVVLLILRILWAVGTHQPQSEVVATITQVVHVQWSAAESAENVVHAPFYWLHNVFTGAVPCALQMGHLVVMFFLLVIYSDWLTSLQNFTSTRGSGEGALLRITNGTLLSFPPSHLSILIGRESRRSSNALLAFYYPHSRGQGALLRITNGEFVVPAVIHPTEELTDAQHLRSTGAPQSLDYVHGPA